jgi:hypothetical protein
MFSEPRTAKLHIANEIARGNVDAHAYVVRGVVLVREEGDPR